MRGQFLDTLQVKIAMIRAGVSAKKLAEEMDYSRGTLSNKINGKSRCKLPDLNFLARRLCVDPEDIIQKGK